MLNPALNLTTLAADFARDRRILVRDVLATETADRLERCLRAEVPWGLSTSIGGEGRTILAAELQAMSPGEHQALLDRVHRDGREGYQYLFNTYQMVTAYLEKRDPGLYLHRFFEFMNSPAVLDFARRVTGHPEIVKADAQATRYLPGHFLKRHNDLEKNSRIAAYVLNLSHVWQADWGGLLQFLDDDGAIEESWLPTWNGLVLFAVPTWHCVSCVAPFATAPRLAITGWFRSAEPY